MDAVSWHEQHVRIMPKSVITTTLLGEFLIAISLATIIRPLLTPLTTFLIIFGGIILIIYSNTLYWQWHQQTNTNYATHITAHSASHLLVLGIALLLPPIPFAPIIFTIGCACIIPFFTTLLRNKHVVTSVQQQP